MPARSAPAQRATCAGVVALAAATTLMAAASVIAQTAMPIDGGAIERLLANLGQIVGEERRVVESLRANVALKRAIDEQNAALNDETAQFNHRANETNAFCSGTYPEPEYSRRKAICAQRNAALENQPKALAARRAELDAKDAARAEEGKSIKASYDSLQQRVKTIEDALASNTAFAPIRAPCAGQSSLSARSKCLNDGWAAAAALAAKAEQDEFDRMNAAWLRKQEVQIHAAVERDARWRREILSAIEQLRVPVPDLRPTTLADAQPGDVLLLVPEAGFAPTRLIPPADWIYRVAEHWASGDTFRESIRTPMAPVSHAVTVVKSVNGHLLFLDQTLEGSRILSRADFERKYGMRGSFMARPSSLVDGRQLWQAARSAALRGKSDYGIFGDKVVCTEKAGLAVAVATGLSLTNHRFGPIDITPGDFFDERANGKYFIITPVGKEEAAR